MTPANLSFQWQRELADKFREDFKIIRGDVLRTNYGSNPWQDIDQCITSVSWLSRIEDANESLLRSQWDLVVVAPGMLGENEAVDGTEEVIEGFQKVRIFARG